jgi:hypothetical protein
MQAIDTEAMDMVNRRIDNYMDTYIDGQKKLLYVNPAQN